MSTLTKNKKPNAFVRLTKHSEFTIGLVVIALFLLAAFFLTVGLVVDLLHRVLDPRLKTATAITEVTA